MACENTICSDSDSNNTVRMGFYRPEWANGTASLKQKYRWFFGIENITGDDDSALPCIRAARPKMNFREMQAEHLNETISYPSKPEWQPIQLVLFDRCINTLNPILSWLKQQYDPSNFGCGAWYPCLDALSFKTCGTLSLYDGCGSIVEQWILEHIYPQNIDFGELDMSSGEVVTVEFTLRYDRAYQIRAAANGDTDHILYTTTTCGNCFEPACTYLSPPSQEITIPPSQSPGNNPSPGGGTSPGGGPFGMAEIRPPDFMMI